MVERFLIRRDPIEVVPFLDSIRSQADGERKALGFLPESAYVESARQRKLVLLIAQDGENISYVGHLLFGGIFPILRVRQIVIAPKYRRSQHATTLLRALVAQGEREGYLNIVANVATDLSAANAFYESNGFLSSRLKAGGISRNRIINVRILQLDTPSLISYMVGGPRPKIELTQSRRRSHSSDVPIYAIDLNVFFDAIKDRARSRDAGFVFEAALSHQIRIAVSTEFSSELKRTSHNPSNDPVLSFAKNIPALPPQEKSKLENLAALLAKIVFPEKSAQQRLKPTDKSDVMHLAHAITSGASGYVTSDTEVLNARDSLMSKFGLDVIGLSEFVELLDLPRDDHSGPSIKASKNFRVQVPTPEAVAAFLQKEGVSVGTDLAISDCRRLAVFDDDGIIGINLLRPAPNIDQASRSVVCVVQDHPFSSTVADFLVSEQVRHCANKSPCNLYMMDIPSHPITRRVAIGQGFQQVHGETALYKIALGQPVTQSTWNKGRLSIERLTGMKLQHVCPQYDSPVELTMEDGKAMNIQLFDLETILSPTIFAFPKRKAVIVPITRAFAADLLGTDDQYSFLEVPEAHFLTRRTYFNTTRAARVMVPGAAIAFYESLGGGGRGAVVALARIVDVTSVPKDRMPNILQRGAVVDDVGTLIRAARVLATTFDNLVILRRPVPFKTLRKIGCVTGANFVSATSIADKHLTAIIDAGG